MSQKQLSRRIGVSKETLTRWEAKGLREGPESRLLRILQGLEYIERSVGDE
jgi:DNA-binding transcriptional regulator YiaG